MDTLLQDLRYALRSLRRSPGFAAVAVLTLALGIGANTAIFSVARGLVFEVLPFDDAERLVNIDHVTRQGWVGGAVAWEDFRAWQGELGAFESLAARALRGYTLAHDGADRAGALKARGYRVTPNFFTTLGARPLLGRGFVPEEGEAGRDDVVVLSEQVWRQHFGADPGIVGRTVRVDGAPRTVVGVLRGEHRFPAGADLWVPLVPSAEELEYRFIGVIGRLRPGVTLEQARAELAAIQGAREQLRPENERMAGTRVVTLADQQSEGKREMIFILLVAVGFVLLIACANVAGMLLARATSRGQEIAVRAALGAGRARIARQLLTESLVLALLAGAVGIVLGRCGIDVLTAGLPPWMVQGAMGWERIGVDSGVLAYTLAISLATGLLFGLAPALHAARGDVARALRDGSRAATGRRPARAQRALVAFEVALAVVLLAGAGLLIRSMIGLNTAPTGFDGDGVLALEFSLPPAKCGDAEVVAFQDRLLERVRALPGVTEAGLVSNLPMSRSSSVRRFRVVGGGGTGAGGIVAGSGGVGSAGAGSAGAGGTGPGATGAVPAQAPAGDSATDASAAGASSGISTTAPAPGSTAAGVPTAAPVEGNAAWRPATPGYFRAMRIPLLRGRAFTDADREGAPRVVLVSESLARRYFPDGDVLGRRIATGEEEWEVVGVVGDVADYGPENGFQPTIYAPHVQAPATNAFLAVRTSGDAASLAPAVRREIGALDPDVAVARVLPMNDVVAEFRAPDREMTKVLAIFAAMAMLIAAIGLYGVVAYAVERRRREFGIRMALGAGAGDIARLVARWALAPVAAGTALGLLGGLGMGRALSGMLYGVRPGDPAVLAATAVLVLAAAAVAGIVPTRRAVAVDPAATLREE